MLPWACSRFVMRSPHARTRSGADGLLLQNFVQKEEISEAIVQAMISQPGKPFPERATPLTLTC